MARLSEDGTIIFEDDDWESENNPYVKRFNDYRAGADRNQTKYSEQEKLLADLQSDDPAAQQAAAERLGMVFVEEEPETPPEAGSQLSALEQRIAAFEQREQEQQQQRQQEQEESVRVAAITAKLDGMGLQEGSGDDEWVIARAFALGLGEDGLPKLDEAYSQLQARDAEVLERYRKGKKAPRINRGQIASEQKNILEMSDDERLDHVMAQHEMD